MQRSVGDSDKIEWFWDGLLADIFGSFFEPPDKSIFPFQFIFCCLQ
ncbi:hypothetical protein LEP1GSC188_0993 [Leptospira weilii serovar Topaz str. LT2116]|uniref:Uncharacterized protein n=1 Tax=Leptospira weilii serovar Topaz str. LT2116 TaxID=1088540 RepID=M3FIP4_9LEPT|nr:hypothetical protein LEP1GSC188_0993 [Leptospira weilii serovar Topaz str. LT2116]